MLSTVCPYLKGYLIPVHWEFCFGVSISLLYLSSVFCSVSSDLHFAHFGDRLVKVLTRLYLAPCSASAQLLHSGWQ